VWGKSFRWLLLIRRIGVGIPGPRGSISGQRPQRWTSLRAGTASESLAVRPTGPGTQTFGEQETSRSPARLIDGTKPFSDYTVLSAHDRPTPVSIAGGGEFEGRGYSAGANRAIRTKVMFAAGPTLPGPD